jgi:hypothetical protein
LWADGGLQSAYLDVSKRREEGRREREEKREEGKGKREEGRGKREEEDGECVRTYPKKTSGEEMCWSSLMGNKHLEVEVIAPHHYNLPPFLLARERPLWVSIALIRLMLGTRVGT